MKRVRVNLLRWIKSLIPSIEELEDRDEQSLVEEEILFVYDDCY